MINRVRFFKELFTANTEEEVSSVLQGLNGHSGVSWKPYGNNESNFGVMEAQQASPVPALVEKLTNSIDAILMKRCYEEGIDPKSKKAPNSVEEAVSRFFPRASSWDLPKFRSQQAQAIQIIANGPKRNSSLLIYDNGEGQHPEAFEDTFLSLLRGNKTEIHFVQGKYNMGGTGAIVFCGKKKYQLVASKRYDDSGNFGYTLVRRHPLSEEESKTKRSTWYEYLTFNGVIPNFPINSLDLGLHDRKFKTGTIIKLYSYQLPPNTVPINRELNTSINEWLFEPALPVSIVEQKERYPNDNALFRSFYGLKRRLEEESNKYLESHFQVSFSDKEIGEFTATVYVFKPRVKNFTVKETKEAIKREYFKNNMSVTLSLNGQVHGFFTQEFVTRTLKYQLIKDYLLIHVDCTGLQMEFRNELFMASRDRAKSGEEMTKLREILGRELRKSRLNEIYKKRKANIAGQGENSDDLLKNFATNLPLNTELLSLLNQAMRLEKTKPVRNKQQNGTVTKKKRVEIPFHPKRFPSKFKIDSGDRSAELPLIKIPLNGEKSIKFATDVEDAFFERIEDPGELKLGLVKPAQNESTGGDQPGTETTIEDVFSIGKSSPSNGTIRVNLKHENELSVGEKVQIKATLSSKVEDFDEIFEVQFSAPEKPKKSVKQPKISLEQIGLPKHEKVFEKQNPEDDLMTWENLSLAGLQMDHETVIQVAEESSGKLETIYINMDSSVIKKFRAKLTNESQIIVADNRYVTTVYFHTLFLYLFLSKQKYSLQRETTDGQQNDVLIPEHLELLFGEIYSNFLMNFQMEALLESIAD